MYRTRKLALLTLAFAVVVMCMKTLLLDLVILFVMKRFDWSQQHLGHFLALQMGCQAVSCLVVLPILVRFVRDHVIVWIGMFAYMAQCFLYARWGTSHESLFICACVGVLAGMTLPALRSQASKVAGPDFHFQVFTGLAVVEASVGFISPLILNS